MERQDEEMILDEFREYLRNRGLGETSVKDDISRVNIMKKRNIDYKKRERLRSRISK